VFIPFVIGGHCFENFFFVSGQLVESLLISADFLQQYEIEGHTKECKVTDNEEAELEPQESWGHGLPETADDDVTQCSVQIYRHWSGTTAFFIYLSYLLF
jgi:hypothetical protein